jgi:hypothetical protein
MFQKQKERHKKRGYVKSNSIEKSPNTPSRAPEVIDLVVKTSPKKEKIVLASSKRPLSSCVKVKQ